MNNPKPVRLGVIGLGNIGQYHAQYLLAGKVTGAELVAVANPSPEKLAKYDSVKTFPSGADLIGSGAVDAVIIATPHFQHAQLGIAAFRAGLHVLVEKPIAAHKADAERLIAAHRQHPELVFCAMFQLRVEPRYQKLRQLITEGHLGQIVRVTWINTDWYRTEAYYASSAWRATWKGEGGGVLINQCLHNLDILQWLFGMPKRVRGFCQFGRFHQIEVEDNVTAYFEWENGATGVFISSTGEAPGSNRLEVAGSHGLVVLENDRLVFIRNEHDMIEFSRTAKQGFKKPGTWHVSIPFENAAQPHVTITQNFVNAIVAGESLIAPGADGLHSIELANAIVYSAIQGNTIELPLDGAAWENELNRLIAESKLEKKVVKTDAADFTSSFRR